jgi:prepilin-type N-terminal cleavage/methylation domain-containing protein
LLIEPPRGRISRNKCAGKGLNRTATLFPRHAKNFLSALDIKFVLLKGMRVLNSMRKAGFGLQRGVTLVELLVVMVILSIALAIVAPSMSNSYENWMLRSAGRRTVAFFRFASDIARRDGTEVAGYYTDHRFVLSRDGSILKQLEIPPSIQVRPERPHGAVFLPTGQIIAVEPYVLENERGRRMTVEVGPLPGQVSSKETIQ